MNKKNESLLLKERRLNERALNNDYVHCAQTSGNADSIYIKITLCTHVSSDLVRQRVVQKIVARRLDVRA